ncbi:MAG TPA: hypothetical protein PKD59_10730 [Miltoncostaeaceae bacterium]|nr:hypothetical protein [Miltoncostaeaceae bacterium]
MPSRRNRVCVAMLGLAAAASPAAAATQVTSDGAGRPITFDVRAGSGADVSGYTAILDGLLHGAEISSVVVTVIPEASVAGECGDGRAIACYRWSSAGDASMFVPAVPAAQVRSALTHEYGHHIDATRPHVSGARGLDGTASWWRARDMAARLARGEVAWDYSLGWDHSIAEIYAEDYAVTNGVGPSGIGWLGDPPAAVRDAIRADLAGAVASPAPPTPAPAPASQPAAGGTAAPAPAIARRSGRLAAGSRARISFAVTDRRRLAVRISGATSGRLRAVLRCNRRPRGGATARPERPAVVRARVAPGRCRVTVRALDASSRFHVVVRGV